MCKLNDKGVFYFMYSLCYEMTGLKDDWREEGWGRYFITIGKQVTRYHLKYCLFDPMYGYTYSFWVI